MLDEFSELLALCQKIFGEVKSELKRKKESSQIDEKKWFEENQSLVHGIAWLATYVESLNQLINWAKSLHGKKRLFEFESLVLEVAFAEYLQQISHGIPMSQTEFIRLQHFGDNCKYISSLLSHPKYVSITNQNYLNNKKKYLVQLALEKDTSVLFEQTGLDHEYQLIRDQFNKYNNNRVKNAANSWHKEDQLIPQKILDELGQMGVFGLTIPEIYGGLGLNKLAMCVVSEELSRGYIGIGSLSTRTEIASELILAEGTEDQKKDLLPKIASGQIIPAAVFTEPDSGSDLGSIKTVARKNEDKYLVTGNKTWITHASRSDLMIILARTNPDNNLRNRGLSILLSPKARGTPESPFPDENIAGTEIKVLGYRGMKEFELRFENFSINKVGLLGGIENKGFAQLMKTFESARIQTAARSVGVAQNALDLAISYANTRTQFNEKLINFQRIYNKIALMIVETILGRQLVYYAATIKDRGRRCDLEAGMAKLLCGRIAWSCADNSLQIHGGNGYAIEYDISRVLCDARVLSIFEGTAEIQAQVIGRRVLADSLR